MATLEEASCCPKCQQPGQEVDRRSAGRGQGVLVTFVCKVVLCKWYDAVCRVVQVRPDGTIPDPDVRPRPKQFPSIKPGNMTRALDQLEELLRQSEQPGGGEIRGR